MKGWDKIKEYVSQGLLAWKEVRVSRYRQSYSKVIPNPINAKHVWQSRYLEEYRESWDPNWSNYKLGTNRQGHDGYQKRCWQLIWIFLWLYRSFHIHPILLLERPPTDQVIDQLTKWLTFNCLMVSRTQLISIEMFQIDMLGKLIKGSMDPLAPFSYAPVRRYASLENNWILNLEDWFVCHSNYFMFTNINRFNIIDHII